ncbi:hypothetical protein, partial [Streptomyces sp. ZEA17I]|uniref:hypothetical protein n=1 Tax=Streptomyces sp. ZEA17I TaxID=2202516 RepID=UPI001C63D6A6
SGDEPVPQLPVPLAPAARRNRDGAADAEHDDAGGAGDAGDGPGIAPLRFVHAWFVRARFVRAGRHADGGGADGSVDVHGGARLDADLDARVDVEPVIAEGGARTAGDPPA